MERLREKFTFLHGVQLGTLLLAALGVRIFRIGTESLWFDECVTYMALHNPSIIGFFREEAQYDPVMVPVYYGAAYIWYHLGFTSIVAVRMLSVVASLAAIIFLYFWTRSLFNHAAGLAAAVCMSFAKLQIYMSQEIRNYAFTMLLALVAMYLFHEAVKREKRTWWILSIAANIVLAYTHFFALLLLLAQGVFLLITRPKRILWIAGWTAVHLPFLALMPIWIHNIVSSPISETGWIPWAPVNRLFDAYYFVFAGSLQDAMDFVRVLPFGIPVHHMLGVAMLAAGACYVSASAIFYLRKAIPMEGFKFDTSVMLVTWLFVPPTALFILGRIVQPCFIERYVLYSATALFIVAGGAIAVIPTQRLQHVALCLLMLIFAGNLVDSARPLRHDFRSTGEVLATEFQQGDKIFACFDTLEMPLRYYANVPKDAIVGSEDFVQKATSVALAGKRSWIWFIHVPDRFEPTLVESVAFHEGLKYQRWQFLGRWHTYLYRIEPHPNPVDAAA